MNNLDLIKNMAYMLGERTDEYKNFITRLYKVYKSSRDVLRELDSDTYRPVIDDLEKTLSYLGNEMAKFKK